MKFSIRLHAIVTTVQYIVSGEYYDCMKSKHRTVRTQSTADLVAVKFSVVQNSSTVLECYCSVDYKYCTVLVLQNRSKMQYEYVLYSNCIVQSEDSKFSIFIGCLRQHNLYVIFRSDNFGGSLFLMIRKTWDLVPHNQYCT